MPGGDTHKNVDRHSSAARCACSCVMIIDVIKYKQTNLGLLAWADSQRVTNCGRQIISFEPLDRSPVSARHMEFDALEFVKIIRHST